MTSLAVKFATSSTEHTGRGTDRNRERERGQQAARGRRGGVGAASCSRTRDPSGRHWPPGKRVYTEHPFLLSQLQGSADWNLHLPTLAVGLGIPDTPWEPQCQLPLERVTAPTQAGTLEGTKGKLCSWGVAGTGLGWPLCVTCPPNPDLSPPQAQGCTASGQPGLRAPGQLLPLGRRLRGSDPGDRWQEACWGLGGQDRARPKCSQRPQEEPSAVQSLSTAQGVDTAAAAAAGCWVPRPPWTEAESRGREG